MSECRRIIERSERRLEKIDAERATESAQLNEARSRLTRLEAQAAVLPPDIPRQPTVDVSVELEELRAMLVSTERERDGRDLLWPRPTLANSFLLNFGHVWPRSILGIFEGEEEEGRGRAREWEGGCREEGGEAKGWGSKPR